MKQRFKNTVPIHKTRIEQFWNAPKQMKKSTPIHKTHSFLSPQRRTVNYTQSIQKTKTLKKHNYFNSQINEQNDKKKQKQNGLGNVLQQLANYVEEKNGQIPWTKRYDWEEMLVSSGKTSQQAENEQSIEYKRDQNLKKENIDFNDSNSFSINKRIAKNFNFSEQKQQDKIEQKKQQKKQEQQWQSQTESLVDFLLRINKISKTQSFNSNKDNYKNQQQYPYKQHEKQKYQKKQSQNINIKDSESDSDDFEQLMMMVQKQQQKRRLKRDSNIKQQQLQKRQQNDSPVIVVARRGYGIGRNVINDDDEDSNDITINHNNKNHSKYTNNSNNKIFKNNNNKNTNNKRSSQYKPCRLKKQRQQQTTCTICMGDIQKRTRLQCRHQFCLQCIKDWLQKTSSCPICRKDSLHYTYQNQKFKIQQKQYSLENYVNNIGDDSDDQQFDDDDNDVDFQCENCQSTQIGDEIIICDGCLVNASHVECDQALSGVMPPEEMNWYCSVCRESRLLWFLQKRSLARR